MPASKQIAKKEGNIMDDQRKKIEQTTFEILQKYNDSKDSCVDIVKIARNMGFTVCEADFYDEIISFVASSKEKMNYSGVISDKIICISRELSWVEKREAVARELGCFLDNENEESYIHKTCEDKIKDINLFVASLLIPANRLVKENEILLKQDIGFENRTKMLAQKFGVTWIMMVYRFGELGIY